MRNAIFHPLRVVGLYGLIGALVIGNVLGQTTVSSPPMGYVKISLKGSTDNLVTVPLLLEPVVIGSVIGASSNSISLGALAWTLNADSQSGALTVGTVTWTPGQFTQTGSGQSYYAEILTGPLKGISYPIVSNTVDTVVLNTGTDDLTAHKLGALSKNDTVKIRPAWTIGSIFGMTDTTLQIDPFTSQPTAQQVDSGDSLFFFDLYAVGLQKTPVNRYIYVQGDGWRSLGDSTTDQNGVTLPPLYPLLVRRHNQTDQDLIILGDAVQSQTILRVPGGDGQRANDAFLSVARSEPVSLDNAGLFNPSLSDLSQNAVKASPDVTQREDLLLAFDPNRKGFNRSPEHIYFYLDGQGWREVGSDSATVGQDVLLNPSRVYILRKRANSLDQYWFQNTTP